MEMSPADACAVRGSSTPDASTRLYESRPSPRLPARSSVPHLVVQKGKRRLRAEMLCPESRSSDGIQVRLSVAPLHHPNWEVQPCTRSPTRPLPLMPRDLRHIASPHGSGLCSPTCKMCGVDVAGASYVVGMPPPLPAGSLRVQPQGGSLDCVTCFSQGTVRESDVGSVPAEA